MPGIEKIVSVITEPDKSSKTKEFVKKFMKRKTAMISLAFIVFIILMAIIGPYVVPYDPQAPDYTAMMQGPSAAHIWGTNEYGDRKSVV